MTRPHYTCPRCGRTFPRGGHRRHDDYLEHLCLPRVMRLVRALTGHRRAR